MRQSSVGHWNGTSRDIDVETMDGKVTDMRQRRNKVPAESTVCPRDGTAEAHVDAGCRSLRSMIFA